MFALAPHGEGLLVNGFVDAIASEPDGTRLVVDYKSDRLGGADPVEVVERDYRTQRLVYALAALRAGAVAVEVVHVLLERPEEPVAARFTAADAPALEAELVAVCAGVVEERFSVAPTPHDALCSGCPGRGTLCSWPEEETRRELVPLGASPEQH